MKLLLIPVWASLAALSAHASVASASPALSGMPEPSTATMFILGVCAIGLGVTGRRRRADSE